MMEIITCLVVGGAIGTVISYKIVDEMYNKRLERLKADNEQLEEELYSVKQKEYSERGKKVKEERKEEEAQAMAEAAVMLKAGKKPEEIAKELLPKYPNVVMKLAKKFGVL